MRLPITAWTSIAHRASGVFLFAGVGVLIWMLDTSLASPESFAALQESLSGVVFKLVLWAVMAGLIYHSVAGVKHLIMDMGIGETMEGGSRGSKIVIGLSAVLILLVGVWIW